MDSYTSAYAPLLDSVASEAGVDPDYLARIMKIESGGDPNNRTGSYRGLFQLSPSEFSKYGGTGDIYDPEQNARAAANKTAAESQAFEAKFGRAPTSTDLYMTHQQGEGGYANHIANPDAPAWQNMFATAEGRQKGAGWAKQAIWGNIPDSLKSQFGSVNNVTSQDLIDIYARKLGYGADRLPLAFAAPDTVSASRLPADYLAGDDPGVLGSGSPAGNPVDAGNLPEGLPLGLRNMIARAPGGDAAMPPNARLTDGPAPPGVPTPAPPQQGGNLPFGIPGTFLNNPVQSKLGDNFSTLLAFAGGARQGGIGQGLTNAAKASLIEGPQVENRRLIQQQQSMVYSALRQKGVPHADAVAMAASPELFKAQAPEIFGNNWEFKTLKNSNGDEVPMWVNRRTQESKPAGGDAGIPGLGNANLAPGVKVEDQSLPADEYLNQFNPKFQADVKSYAAGDTLPTGNPRKGYVQEVKSAAKLWGEKQGLVVSDSSFSEKRKYRTELGSNSATTAGGQSKAFVQGIEHADALATKLEGLRNWNGMGIPFLAAGANAIREGASNTQKGLADEARAIGQTLAGEVGKLFSGSAGGGVHEREMTRNRFNTVSSGPELAGALEGTIETMEGGLRALEVRRDQILGPNNDVKFVAPDTEKKIAHIREIIQRLKSGSAQGAPTAAPAAAPQVDIDTGAPISGGTTKTGVPWRIK